MGTPQIILIVLLAIGGTVNLLYHGRIREHNFVYWLVSAAIEVGILYWGGFFR